MVINSGTYTHISVAILDALHAYQGPVIESHLANIHRRDAFSHRSYISLRADGVMAGFGTEGYEAAVRRVCTMLA